MGSSVIAATRDANGNVNGQLFDAGGNLMQESHADGGIVTNRYNAFGDLVQTIDAVGNAATASAQTKAAHTTAFAYDKMSRRLSVTHGPTNVYTITYHAASAGQTLTVTLLKTGNLNGRFDGSADLIAAYLDGAPVSQPVEPQTIVDPVSSAGYFDVGLPCNTLSTLDVITVPDLSVAVGSSV